MPLQLRNDLHWCDCGGRAVFLDTLADLYFCLPQTANDAFLRTAARRSRTGDEAQLQILMKRGMLIESDARANIPPPPQIEIPTRDLLEEPALHASRTLILRALLAELGAAWSLRRKSFHMVIEAARLARSTGSNAPRTSALQEIAAAAAAAAFITRSHERCLVRALAVHSMCKEIAATPKLVFGVVAHPFTAHCWVQLGSAVIVGGYEQARLYTPILVIE